jgi:glycosyltransferase involved in cell wall biosynthesis
MASGKPIVLGAEPDQESVPLRDGDTALFARPGDSSSLLDAFRRLEADAGLRERLGGAVGRFALEHMDSTRVAEAWLEVVEEAIASYGKD